MEAEEFHHLYIYPSIFIYYIIDICTRVLFASPDGPTKTIRIAAAHDDFLMYNIPVLYLYIYTRANATASLTVPDRACTYLDVN